MITLAFLLDHQVISRSDKNTVVAGSKNYVRARFILRTDDWARPITAIFGGYTQLLDDNNECTVPWEVLQQPGKVEVSAFCGDLHTANIAVVPVEKSGYKSGETPKDPTPDVYQQFLQAVKDDATAAENAAKTAQEQAQAAAGAAEASAESASDAENARQEAVDCADAAAKSAESAAKSAALAQQSAKDAAASAKEAGQARAGIEAAVKQELQKAKDSGEFDGRPAGFGTPTATAHLVDGPPTVAVTASGPDTAKMFHFDFGIPAGEEQHEEYTGPTEVEPEFREIKLETKGTALNDDITIKPIQMTTIENPAGGNTLII